jgi:hypothetical protein
LFSLYLWYTKKVRGIKAILLFVILGIFFLVLPKSIHAQITGGCLCSINGATRTTYVLTSTCSNNSVPTCASATASTACSCKAIDTTSTTCGHTNQNCCDGNTCIDTGLSCYVTAAGNKCMSETSAGQIPGGAQQAPSGTGAAGTAKPDWKEVCDYAGEDSEACRKCFEKFESYTAIGCVPSNPQDLIKLILTFGMGIAGGIAFLLILLGGFQIMTSAGNPEQLNSGRELVASAVIGLILILLSIFLLKVIGVDVFGLPGFS